MGKKKHVNRDVQNLVLQENMQEKIRIVSQMSKSHKSIFPTNRKKNQQNNLLGINTTLLPKKPILQKL